jgi:uncharacterized protein (TIGR03083 family)
MTDPDLWPLVRDERLRFADLLATLTSDDWRSPSLAAGWSVQDVAAHCIATAHTTPGSFVTQFAAAGFNFSKFAERNIRRYGAGTPDELVTETRATAGRTTKPPGPPQVPISEIVVHSEDVARPLGRTLDRSPQALVASLDFYQGAQPLVGAKKRSEGLHLVASDVDWQHGSGPTVSGPAIALLLAMSGRAAGLADLTGDGVGTMSARMPGSP